MHRPGPWWIIIDDNGGSDYDLSDRDDKDNGEFDDDSDDHTWEREGGVGRSLRISMQGCTKWRDRAKIKNDKEAKDSSPAIVSLRFYLKKKC